MKQMIGKKTTLTICASTCFFLVLASCGQKPSQHEWKSFVSMAGHTNVVPAEWVSTPEGKFAHAIKIPNSVSADSGYKWTMSSREYFDHLCATEAGSFIFKKVEGVEGFAMLRAIVGNTEEQQKDPWWQEAPGLQGKYSSKYEPLADAAGFVEAPYNTYGYVEMQEKNRDGFIKFAGYMGWEKFATIEARVVPKSRYAVTWRGIRRENDRENLISGYEWIVLDTQANEVLAVLRNFSQTGSVQNAPKGIYWQISRQCPVLHEVNGTNLIVHEDNRWIPRVLKPTIKPRVLQVIDKELDPEK